MSHHALSLDVTPNGPSPLYRQISRQLAAAIAARLLTPGEPLAPHQEVAELLVISPLAVRRAYEELVRQGLVRQVEADRFRVAHRLPPTADAGESAAAPVRSWAAAAAGLAQELAMAREVQRGMLPPAEVEAEGFVMAARQQPARFVSGDFFDLLTPATGSGPCAVVGDVAGTGAGAALVAARVQASLPLAATGCSMGELLSKLNRGLAELLGPRRFVALAAVHLDAASGRLELANAGLPDPWLLSSSGAPRELVVPGPRLPLGLTSEVGYRTLVAQLHPGDRVLLYTDGLPEARRGDGSQLGYEALARCLVTAHEKGAGGGESAATEAGRWLDGLLAELGEAAVFEDDWTALVLERRLPAQRQQAGGRPS